MELFEVLGFQWDRGVAKTEVSRHSRERVCFHLHKMLPSYVWDAGVLEGNPCTFPEVKTLLEGVTVGGRKLSDQEQILNLAESARALLNKARRGEFRLDKATFVELHGMVARNEALEWGMFRGEGGEIHDTPKVALGKQGYFDPLPTLPGAPELNRVSVEGCNALAVHVPSPFERGLAFFLFGALQQFFFEGNKRTSRLMMNGILLSEGIDAISVPAARAQEFNAHMVNFYLSRNGTRMMQFLAECHPDHAPAGL